MSLTNIHLIKRHSYMEVILNGNNIQHKETKTESAQLTLEISVSPVMG